MHRTHLAVVRSSAPLLLVLVAMFVGSARAQDRRPPQSLPKHDVVDVPAIGDGLCVANVFQSNMVVQRDRPIAVWGWASPGERVAVTFGQDRQEALAGADRAWRVVLAAQPANDAPQQMLVTGKDRALTLDNVLVGDVWVLGGQSNMEFELEKVENGPLEIVSANFPRIRVLTVPYGVGPEQRRSFPRLFEWSDWFGRHFRKGDWDECTPAIARELSAIGFTFARRVHLASGVPIGVVDASRGGTTVESWTPLARLRAIDEPFLREKLADWDRRVAEWTADGGKPAPLADPNHPGHGFAGMIGPLEGLAVRGVLFHQGYNNAFDGEPGVALYRAVLPETVRAWRAAFGDPELPFGILSLCTEGYPQTRDDYVEKMLDTGILIRAAHYETCLAFWRAGDQNIGYADTYDLRRRWYHPQVKIPAGERIARWALATQYGFGRELEWKPPMLVGTEVRDGSLLLRFDRAVGDPGDGAIQGFAIAGDDRRFQPADAAWLEVGKDDRGNPKLDQRQLVLTSPLVEAPQHFRYAWGRNPLANVQALGHKDLPLPTQRSDDWPVHDVPLGVLGEPVTGALTRAQLGRVRQMLRREDVRRRVAEAEAVLREFAERGEKK
jgi:sialate O-acetylesterase